ncbi:MAG: class I SAM-dependent DNA methyltransferase [Ruminococcus sp.]|nr:class I SAM-dependent DNA methyltransferase [Ruminococcus sp.]
MTEADRKRAAKAFAEYWKDRGDEKSDSQSFWLSLARDVLGVAEPEKFILFEERVKLDHTSFIDGHIPSTHVLIEQKKKGLNLRSPIRQSDGTLLNPFQQAQRYSAALPYSQRPRWIITCNFEEFLIYDMEKPTGEPESIMLKDLGKEYYRLQFLVEEKSELLHREEQISIKAGELVGKLYDAILKQYIHPDSEETLRSLNMLCVRLVFCLYAEDAGIFGGHLKFHNYIKSFNVKDVRRALIDLFRVLDTKTEERDPYMDDALAAFPYVNGGLFADENIEIPNFTQDIVDLLLHNASEDFDWSQISPTIFGAVFESTLNPETRRSGGMHYTSIENIHKVIDPLFLDELREELAEIKELKVPKIRNDKAEAFREKLSKLTFFDPACGSGNFLTETYISLRRLENEALVIVNQGQILLGYDGLIKVSIGQFYGIEINDFAVTVAKTALWIAESQMLKETEDIVNMSLDFLPLKSYANIVEGNALRTDWETVVPKDKLNYIMGNPPFVGHQWRSKSQAEDMEIAFYDLPKHGKLDYVCGWYNKACDYMKNTRIKTAFVSTNSIIQGESVGILWSFLFNKGVEIQFAHRSFSWSSESSKSATVHCVIIGMTYGKLQCQKKLYDGDRMTFVNHINGYLVDAPDIFIQSRGKPLTKGFPEMSKGSQPTDGGYLLMSEQDRVELITKYPEANEFIRPFVGSDDLIKGKKRFCLWLKNISPAKYRHIAPIMARLKGVAESRLKSPTASVRRDADTPMLFTQIRQPDTNYLAVPEVSSENRRYIPISFLSPEIIGSNKLYIVSNADKYMFGVLISNVHMAWMRTVAGRLELRYSYSPAVYNNFPWCNPTAEQKKKIEETAQAILDARALYPDCSLADLYDEVAMPPELRKAHQANDRAVMQAYGFDVKTMTESTCVAELMKMYQKLVSKGD